MHYVAIYEIDYGLQNPLRGGKPDTYLVPKRLFAESPEEAFRLAVEKAVYYVKDLGYSLPGQVTVRIASFHDVKANTFAQGSLNRNPELEFDEGRAVVRSSQLDNLLK